MRIRELFLKPFSPNRRNAGMSLIEIILVIALVGTLMTVLITNLTQKQDEAMKDTARLSMQRLMQNLEEYRIHHYKYPANLDALVENPGSKKWRGPYAEKDKLKDPWDQPFEYESDGRKVKIISPGPDGEVGTEDDVVFPDDDESDS